MGATALDLNVQYYGRYSVTNVSGFDSAQAVRFQGAGHVPAQAYVDVSARRRLTLGGSGPLRAVDALISVQNLLDHAPPIVTPDLTTLGFSPYGDPRGRRVVLSLSAQF
jgi:outer membrane receptor protein involved in Fe transport